MVAVAAGLAAGILTATVAHLGGVAAADIAGLAVGIFTFLCFRGDT